MSNFISVMSLLQEHLSAEAVANLRTWLTDEAFAEFRPAIWAEIEKQNWTELENCFYTTIPFGTGGRRGPRGLGPNRINRRTIAESAKGLANWVSKQGAAAQRRGVVIACDTRIASQEFAEVSAQVIAASGVQVYLFESFRPTPELSFAVRHLNAQAGVVISASHNPPSDNGFKAYGPDGAQVVPPDDVAIMQEVQRVSVGAIPLMDLEEGKRTGLIRIIGAEVDAAYQDALTRVTLTTARNVRIVFTPLHGTGGIAALPALARAGFRDVHVVEEQSFPDGNFPHVENHKPNPEELPAMKLAAARAAQVDADVALATDPDADRLGVVAKRTTQDAECRTEYRPMTGNQVGSILCYFILNELHRQGRLPADGLILKTAVTTDLLNRIADHFGVGRISELLVGFKYIGCVIRHLDDPDRFLFGMEESLGYLSRPHARDKDGINAALLVAEAAARTKEDGKDLWWLLHHIYRRFGYFSEHLENYVRPGKSGQLEIAAMMRLLRERPPQELAGMQVREIVDRLTDEVRDSSGKLIRPFEPLKDPKTGKVIQQLTLAKDNLLIFHLAGNGLADGGKVAVRPSGTEPKCKFYISVHRRVPEDISEADLEAVKRQVDALAMTLKDDILQKAAQEI
ncbi:MAG: phospho-sugar mutase [Abditibacteriales bacterium]|nr:phospho-sugar mutase [Abditibacteriales bacterium]MDW8365590.1 phospho-sugar mutase [Abditibacteriales bacterium]